MQYRARNLNDIINDKKTKVNLLFKQLEIIKNSLMEEEFNIIDLQATEQDFKETFNDLENALNELIAFRFAKGLEDLEKEI